MWNDTNSKIITIRSKTRKWRRTGRWRQFFEIVAIPNGGLQCSDDCRTEPLLWAAGEEGNEQTKSRIPPANTTPLSLPGLRVPPLLLRHNPFPLLHIAASWMDKKLRLWSRIESFRVAGIFLLGNKLKLGGGSGMVEEKRRTTEMLNQIFS